MTKAIMTKESEEKRLSDFKKIAEHWDELPEYAKGKLDGTISAIAALYANVEVDERKTGQEVREDDKTKGNRFSAGDSGH